MRDRRPPGGTGGKENGHECPHGEKVSEPTVGFKDVCRSEIPSGGKGLGIRRFSLPVRASQPQPQFDDGARHLVHAHPVAARVRADQLVGRLGRDVAGTRDDPLGLFHEDPRAERVL